ncbi:UHRF1-binding protein 1-like, partial [Caerostris darwini]
LSRVVLESYCPFFKKKDLRLSRIKEPDRGEVLLFKRLDWQVLRIEAKSRESDTNGISGHIPLTPLRLITNQGCCKMTIKKKLCDCSVIGSRLIFVLDDLLWVLTDAQLVAALHFVQSLSGLVQKATELTQKQKAKQKLEQQPDKHIYSSHNKSSTPLCPAFYRHDVVETSYHVLCSRIDLHLCDDMDPKDGRSQHANLKSGGALQVSLDKLIMDYYPYHRAFSSREHWLHYSEPSSSRSTWIQQLLTLFNEKLQSKMDVSATGESVYSKESPKHSISPSAETTVTDSPSSPDDKPLLTRKASTISNSSGTLTPDMSRKSISGLSRKSSLQWNYRYLMSSCFVLRLEDIVAYKVSTSTSSRTRAIEKFLIYNKSAHMPSDIKTIHLEQTSYYLPGEIDFPVPSPNLFLHIGPLKLYLDTPTILWINAFYLNLQKCLMSLKLGTTETPSFVNVRVEALLPQIVIPSDANSPTQPDRPRTLQLQSSRAIATNCRLGDHTTRTDLNECLETFSSAEMFSNTSKFPWRKDKKPLANAYFDHVIGKESDMKGQPTKIILTEATDIWSIYLDPFWAEFTVCESGRTRLQPFIDPLPITLWFYSSQKPEDVLRTVLNKGEPDNFKMCLPNLQSYGCQNNNMANVEVDTSYSNSGNLNNNEDENEADVSITVFKFGKVGFVSHSKLNTNMLLHCGQIETKEEAAISWENFQNNFSTRARSWKNEKMITSLRECEFSMRIDKDYICGIDGSKPQPGPGFMSILASNLYLQLQMNSISGLVEFFEDELVSKPMPSKIILDNLQIQLQEEQPPSGLLSPNSAPLNISLPGCIIERTIDGTLSVLPLPSWKKMNKGYVEKNIGDLLNHTSSSEIFSRSQNIHNSNSCSNGESPGLSICDNSEDEQLSLVKLVQDNKELRSKLNLMKNLEQENQILRQELNLLRNSVEDERLKQLLESRCEIRRLEHEKTTLQETLRLLQNEVNRLETEKQQVNRYH